MNRRWVNKWADLALHALEADWKKCPRQVDGHECPGRRCIIGPHRAAAYVLSIRNEMRRDLIRSGRSLL